MMPRRSIGLRPMKNELGMSFPQVPARGLAQHGLEARATKALRGSLLPRGPNVFS